MATGWMLSLLSMWSFACLLVHVEGFLSVQDQSLQRKRGENKASGFFTGFKGLLSNRQIHLV